MIQWYKDRLKVSEKFERFISQAIFILSDSAAMSSERAGERADIMHGTLIGRLKAMK